MGKEARRKREKRKKQRRASERQGSSRRDKTWVEETPTGRKLHFSDEAWQMLAPGLEAQRREFRRKFGRDPEGDDPIFFDPDEDEPIPIAAAKGEAVMVEAMGKAGFDQAYIYAYQQTGMMPTEMNADLWNEADLAEWDDAIERYRRLHSSDEEIAAELDAMLEQLPDVMLGLTDAIVADDGTTFGEVFTPLLDGDEEGLIHTHLFVILTYWLVGARDVLSPEARTSAVTEAVTLGGERLREVIEASSGFLGTDSKAGELTVNELVDTHGDDLVILGMWVLVAGLVRSEGSTSTRATFEDLGIAIHPGAGRE